MPLRGLPAYSSRTRWRPRGAGTRLSRAWCPGGRPSCASAPPAMPGMKGMTSSSWPAQTPGRPCRLTRRSRGSLPLPKRARTFFSSTGSPPWRRCRRSATSGMRQGSPRWPICSRAARPPSSPPRSCRRWASRSWRTRSPSWGRASRACRTRWGPCKRGTSPPTSRTSRASRRRVGSPSTGRTRRGTRSPRSAIASELRRSKQAMASSAGLLHCCLYLQS
mmetsp:Transcript_65454/g.206856  ORF Transcript_65454/g.206856 Transcript_65454/m.206856 type:complete len:220 (-) Transcript_65454:97-756(-)